MLLPNTNSKKKKKEFIEQVIGDIQMEFYEVS